MSIELIEVMLFLFAIWSGACAIKAAQALQQGRRYRFAMWDGGLLRDGKVLTLRGTQAKLVLVSLLGLGCLLLLTRAVPFRPAQFTMVAIAALSVVSDLAQTEG